MRWVKEHGLKLLVHIAALLPLAIIIWDFAHNNLTANPIEEITLRTGKTTLVLLVLSLTCTPLNTVFGMRWALRLRRVLGLYAFGYACLHFLIFVGVDYRFDFGLIREDVGKKRFVLAGLSAFLSLLILAVTSTRGWQRRLGRNWEHLHWLAYAAAGLAVTHFVWQTREDFRQPALYGAIVALLLLVRLPQVKRTVSHLRKRLTG